MGWALGFRQLKIAQLYAVFMPQKKKIPFKPQELLKPKATTHTHAHLCMRVKLALHR